MCAVSGATVVPVSASTAVLPSPRPLRTGDRSGSASGAALPSRLDCLTSLRFFAAFAVFTHHFTGIGNGTGYGTAPALFPYSLIGGHGVTFFFVLSGFLLAWGHRAGEHPGAFYWRRVARIWPATLVAAPLAVYAFYLAAHQDIDWPSLIASLFLVQAWFPGVVPNLPGNGPTWTLGVELLFYALFPLVIRVAERLRTRWLVGGSAVALVGMFGVSTWADASFAGPTAAWIQRHPVFFLPQFVLGLTLALALRRGWRVPLHPSVPLGALALTTYGYYQGRARLSPEAVAHLDHGLRPVLAVLAVLVVVACVQREIDGRRGLLQCAPVVTLGVWSYSFYLLHHSVNRLALYRWGRAGDDNSVLFDLLGVAVFVCALSWVMYRYVEEPSARWLNRRMPKRWRSGCAA
jgi:peptidoglycan/LPS O-acetylase OafA/YrhL